VIRKLEGSAAWLDSCGSAEYCTEIRRTTQLEIKIMAGLKWFGSRMLNHVGVACFPIPTEDPAWYVIRHTRVAEQKVWRRRALFFFRGPRCYLVGQTESLKTDIEMRINTSRHTH
jgi:hypothetical protein